ncbi:hypothetical protein [Leptolyngbya sp. CCNP1308]|uniref:hypothetical protein n=1 Tax=Leptolyngbya sp. CCNP1308 TaxID=3110255 RepID=UPI002B1FA6A5|nr:hypothetical protein [Leptolyngbya sp. CCNP1308]
MHAPSATGQILATIARDEALSQQTQVICAPQHGLGVLSPFALRQTLDSFIALSQNSIKTPAAIAPSKADLDSATAEDAPPALIIWAFSAGCVGAAALATHWQRHRGPVLSLLMVDGWGVPRDPEVPLYRLSHDRTTHDTSRWLGAGEIDFYADPPVPHVHLWQQPQAVMGWAVAPGEAPQPSTAADFLCLRSRQAIDHYTACPF